MINFPLQSTEHLPRISKESGVNIIVGTSYYVDAFVPPDAKLLSVQEVSGSVSIYMKPDQLPKV